MKAFQNLTKDEQRERLKEVGKLALASYDLPYEKIEFYTEETNQFFHVHGTDGCLYNLKVCQEESSVLMDNLMENFFVDSVRARSDLLVSDIVKTKDGEGVVVVESDLTDLPKRVIVYRWLEGTILDENETNERFEQLGEIIAKLHETTNDLVIPEGMTPKQWDDVFYFVDEPIVYMKEDYTDFISKEDVAFLDRLIPVLNEGLRRFYDKGNAQLIHGDINPWNVLVDGDDMKIIDFEDSLWGFPVHDLAIALFYYVYNENFDYEEVKKNLLAGYAKVREVPVMTEADLGLLMVARRVNFVNFYLTISETPKAFVDRNMTRIRKDVEIFGIL